jgi:ketosteroid isomerase-like protein
MQDFFDRYNAGDREGALELMDERAEMRVHVLDNARTLRGVEQVGGWFMRADKGIRMLPAGEREMGNTVECDVLVIRPGAPSQHLDATFRVEAGKITAINLAPR